MTGACQAPLSRAFPREKYWSGLSFPSPGDLSDPEMEPVSPVFCVGITIPIEGRREDKEIKMHRME